MTFTLFDHQSTVINSARELLRTSSAVILQMATGGGKTPTGAFAVKSASEKGHSVIWTCPRRELVEQTSQTFAKFSIPHSFIAAGRHFNPRMRVQIASIDTLVNRLEKLSPPKLLVVDEAHHSPAAGWLKVIRWVLDSGGKVLGLTATPWRLDSGGFDHIYGGMVKGPPVSWLIEKGFLSDYRLFAPFTPDLSQVHIRAGDYVTSEVEAIMGGKAVVGNCVDHYRRYAHGKRAAVFAVSIQHSEQIAAQFTAAGIPAAHIDAGTPDAIRRQHILNFATGHLKVIVNVGLLSEGFDLSAIAGRDAPIECVILMRPTQSLSLYLQQVGRALRRKPYPAVIIDMVGSCARHGLPDHPHEWSLQGRPKKGRGGKGEQPVPLVKKCSGCDVMIPLAFAVCPHCGTAQPNGTAAPNRKLDEIDGELQEINREQARRERLREQGGAKSLDELIALGKAKGYKNPEAWAGHVYTARLRKQGLAG
ncbi:MAG TPA: DEAD/DEAH box helicase family protein [Urbifossiella sp.]|nr:DEAD/DEAH box helicase family protein [Urbifossiella sp.]